MRTRSSLLSLALAWLAVAADAADWPRWRGPNGDGISAETTWSARWPAEGPRRLWKAEVGIGFSSVSISEGRAFTMGNRDETDTIHCLDATTGRTIWRHSYPSALDPRFYEGGPGGTPTVADGRVYTLGKKGHAFCLDAATGRVIWARDLCADPGLKLAEWSFASSALIVGDLVVFNAGGAGIALDRRTGATVWLSDMEPAGYATPVPFAWKGASALAIFGAKAVIAVAPDTGRELWRYPSTSSRDVNAADPIISGDRMFISSSSGALLLDLGGERPAQAWQHKLMRNYFNPCVLIGGHLYGFDGTTHRPTRLVCLEIATGKVTWSEENFGSGGLIAAGDRLLLLDKGELIVVAARPDRFEVLARATVIGGKCWTAPTLANGLVYCRNAAGDLVCLDLRTDAP